MQTNLHKIDTITTKLARYTLYLLLILIPLTHKEMFSVYDPDLVLSKFALVLLAIIGVILLFLHFKEVVNDVVFVFLLLMLFFQIVSLVNTQSYLHSIRLILFSSAITFSYPAVKRVVQKFGVINILKIINVVYFFIFIFWSFQVLLYKTKHILVGGIWPVTNTDVRYGSTFWDINHFGIYLTTTFLLLLSLNSYLKFSGSLAERFNKILVFVNLITIPVLLYSTKSRSALISLLGSLLFYVFTYIKIRHKGAIKKITLSTYHYLIFAITLLGGTLFVLDKFSKQVHNLFLFRATSLFAHLFLIKVGIIVGKRNFLTGIGVNAFDSYFRSSKYSEVYYFIDPAAKNYKLPLHSLWLEIYTETGMIAFIVFVIFFFGLIYMLYKLSINRSDLLSLGFSSIILAFLIGGLMYSYKAEFFWLLVLISGSYAISQYKFKNIVDFFKVAFSEINITLFNLLFIVIVSCAVLIPFLYIFKPLSYNELIIIESQRSINNVKVFRSIFINMHQHIKLFRYIFGNYSYTPRLLITLYFATSVLLLYGLIRKSMSKVNSIIYLLVVVYVVFVVNGFFFDTSSTWIVITYALFGIATVYSIIELIEKKVNKPSQSCKSIGVVLMINKIINNKIVMLSLLASLIAISILRVNHVRRYDKDKSFILELIHNRGIANNANVYIQDPFIPEDLSHYYLDRVDRVNGVITTIPNRFSYITVNYVENINIDFYVKNLAIGNKRFAKAYNARYKLTFNRELPVNKTDVSYSNVVLIFHELDKKYESSIRKK